MPALGDIPANQPLPFLIGSMLMYAGDAAPAGFRLCVGTLLPVSSDPALAALLGTSYGGDGVSSFGVPDLRKRIPLGKAAAGTGNALGQAGGALDHQHAPGTLAGVLHSHSDGTLYVPSHGHSHSFYFGSHYHYLPVRAAISGGSSASVSNVGNTDYAGTLSLGGGIGGSGDSDIAGATDTTKPNVASGLAALANPPYTVLNYIIAQSVGQPQLGDLPASQDLRAGGVWLPGMIVPTGRRKSALGAGWLACDGSLVRQDLYPNLFALVGHKFNGGVAPTPDGSGNPRFKLPDLTRQFPIGMDPATPAVGTIGKAGGNWDHSHGDGTLTMGSHDHLPGSLASAVHGHGHNLYIPSHNHGIGVASIKTNFGGGYAVYTTSTGVTQLSGDSGLGGSINNAGALGLGGRTGASSDNDVVGATGTNNPPHYYLNFKIRAS